MAACYKVLTSSGVVSPIASAIWVAKVPTEVPFLWLVAKGVTLT